MTDEAKALAVIVWTTSRADEGTISGIGADHVAAAILASDWLAQHDARVRAEALREAADEIESTAAGAWGGNQAWLTTGTHVGNLVTYALRERADRVERGESL